MTMSKMQRRTRPSRQRGTGPERTWAGIVHSALLNALSHILLRLTLALMLPLLYAVAWWGAGKSHWSRRVGAALRSRAKGSASS